MTGRVYAYLKAQGIGREDFVLINLPRGVLLKSVMKAISRADRKRVDAFLMIQPWNSATDKPWQITALFNELLFRLPAIRQGQTHALHGNRVYMYYWRYPSSIPDLGACHAVELAYVFNNLEETIYTGEGVNAELAARAQQMWVNFAKTGDPSTPELRWEPYTREARKTMILDEKPYLKINLHETGRRLLYPLTDYRFNGNYAAVSSEVMPAAAKAAAAAAGVGAATLLIWMLLRKKHDEENT